MRSQSVSVWPGFVGPGVAAAVALGSAAGVAEGAPAVPVGGTGVAVAAAVAQPPRRAASTTPATRTEIGRIGLTVDRCMPAIVART